MGKWIRTTTV